MRHIWWLNHHATPPNVPGSTRHFDLAKAMQDISDWKTTIINGSFDHTSPFFFEEGPGFAKDLKEPLERIYNGVSFYSLPTPEYTGSASLGRLKSMYVYYRQALKYLSSPHIQKPDLIVGSTVHPLAAFAGYRLAKLHRVPFVYEVRDLWPLTLVEIGRISKYHPLVLLLSKLDLFLARKASLIITTAPKLENYYRERLPLPPDRFTWITNGSSLLSHPIIPLRKFEPDDVIRVGYLGALGEANGLIEFLNNLKNIPRSLLDRFHFSFIGNGPLKNRLLQLVTEHSLPIDILSAVPKDKVWESLESFDMLLFYLKNSPIYRYGISPNKLADYYAAGRPMLQIINKESAPFFIHDVGYTTTEEKDLCRLLESVLTDLPQQWQQKGITARKHAEEMYAWPSLSKKLLSALEKVLP